jgi:hypothetical protein
MKLTGFPASKMTRSGLRSMYNIRADPDLGMGKIALRHIPCMCHACAEQLRAPWLVNTKLGNQPRYQSSVNCHWWPIFEGLNDWTVASLVPGKKGEDDESDDIFEAQNLFLDAMARQAQSAIVVGGVGAFATEDPDADCYYLVEWVDEPKTLDEDLSLVKFEPPIVLKR